jgi:hypothetical protein
VLDTLTLAFADIAPEEVQGRWDHPLPDAALPETVLLTREMSKRLWSFVVRRRDPAAGAVIIAAGGASDHRAESVALGMAAALWDPPASVHRAADPETDLVGSTPPNGYIFKMVRDCANLVCWSGTGTARRTAAGGAGSTMHHRVDELQQPGGLDEVPDGRRWERGRASSGQAVQRWKVGTDFSLLRGKDFGEDDRTSGRHLGS